MHARDGRDGHFTLGGAHLALFLGGALVTAAIFGAAIQRYFTSDMPAVRAVGWPLAEDTGRDADFLRGNMNLLAAKIGTLQAKLVSIDGLGQRVAKVAGVAYTDPELAKQLASAQPSVSTQPEASGVMDELFTDQTPPTAASAEELGRQLDDIQVRLAQQSDNLKLLDAALTQRSADQARMPTAMPITDYPYLSSSYGWRRNPVTGRSALHEGLDFSAPPGTPILAASGGVVLESKFHPGYGNMVEIDHGDGLITRYAHASSLLVKQGQLVDRGQQIARVGSTGRSTGPHLHFEVRLAGQPLDPRLFLGPQQNAPPAMARAAGTDSATR
ncbi:M23 family metallopeptidase [Achromobacter sp. AONIH1]|uniref:M23 family metallopeptidase n=1 Tax=unclassified Achromobacter TaxID=2626865 RepID=UPI000CD0468B|nr:M23 family metallopeptidase [Achromobacter sp. AONIH1]AUT46074.1 peptidase M23 [Achromobacter sp. AONIH1]